MTVTPRSARRPHITPAAGKPFGACTCQPGKPRAGGPSFDIGTYTGGTAVSVVVATLGRWRELEAMLIHLAVFPETRNWEVIVISDGGGAPPPINAFDRIHLIEQAHSGAARSRNVGAAHATGEVLAFLDDDVHPFPAWIQAVEHFARSERVALTGPVEARDQTLISGARAMRYERRYRPISCGDEVEFLAGGNSLVRRNAFIAAGGFPLSGIGADNELTGRLQSPPHFCWGLGVSHKNDRGLGRALNNAWSSGRADAQRGRPIGRFVVDFGRPAASAANVLLHSARAAGWFGTRVSGRFDHGSSEDEKCA